jgi:hypothetical protein
MQTFEKIPFEIATKEVHIGGHKVDNVGLVAYDSEKEWPLSRVMGRSYKPFYNKQFQDLAMDMADSLELPEPEYTWNRDGDMVVATIQNPTKMRVGLGNDIDIENNIVLLNPHNGGAIKLGSAQTVIRCTNQESQIFGKVSISHSGNLDSKIAMFRKQFEQYNAYRKQLENNLNQLAHQAVSQSFAENFAYRMHGVKDEKFTDLSTRKANLVEQTINSITEECNDVGWNGFGVKNGISHFVTHKYQKGRNAATGNLFGQAYNLNAQATKMLNSELVEG